MLLTKQMRDYILDNEDVQLDLAKIDKVSQRTIQDRAKSNSKLLTVQGIYEYLQAKGFSKDEILEPIKKTIASDGNDEHDPVIEIQS